jgi:hypothetical protein
LLYLGTGSGRRQEKEEGKDWPVISANWSVGKGQGPDIEVHDGVDGKEDDGRGGERIEVSSEETRHDGDIDEESDGEDEFERRRQGHDPWEGEDKESEEIDAIDEQQDRQNNFPRDDQRAGDGGWGRDLHIPEDPIIQSFIGWVASALSSDISIGCHEDAPDEDHKDQLWSVEFDWGTSPRI